MQVDWKYIYKRRKWTIESVVKALSERTWDEFQQFHVSRGIECPAKDLYEQAVKSLTPKPAATTAKKVTQTRKTVKSKGARNVRRKKTTKTGSETT